MLKDRSLGVSNNRLPVCWDEGDGWIASMRHIALEGRCWVLGAGCAIKASDIPADFPARAQLYPDPEKWLNTGGSVIVSPRGQIVAGPLHSEYGILYADCDPAASRAAHYTLDTAGHYNRPDVFHLTVDRSPRRPIEFGGDAAAETTASAAPERSKAEADLHLG